MKLDKQEKTRNRENEKGAAMIMALLVSFLLLTASAGLLLESSMNAANVTDAVAEQQAYHAAESGIQSAVHVLRCQKNSNPGCGDVVATPLYDPSLSPTHVINQVNYIKAAERTTSNTTGQETDPARLSRFLNYASTCGPDDALCVALNLPGYAYSLELDDPDNTSSFVSVSMEGRFYENNFNTVFATGNTAVDKLTKTYGTGADTLTVTYTPPAAIVDYDMSDTNLNTSYGTLNIARTGAGALITSDNRFDIVVRMTRPYDAVKTVRGWILHTAAPGEVPKVIFDSQTLTLVGSALTLDLATAPSTGWSAIQNIPPDPNNPPERIGYKAQPSLGNNIIGGSMTPPEPVRLLVKSTGYGPRGAKKELQAIIQKNFFNGLTAPAALTLVGPHRTGPQPLNPGAPVDEPVSHFYFSLGQSAVLQYSGVDQASTDIIPPIGTNNPMSLQCVEEYVLNVPNTNAHIQCSDSYPNGSTPFNGSVQGTPSDVTIDMPYWLQTPAALDREIHKLAVTAKSSGRFYPGGTAPTSWGDYATGTGITFCDGDVELGQGISGDGGGILVVTGSLTLKGSFSFKGLIIVTGQGLLRSGGGGGGPSSGEISGNVVVAPYVNSKIVDRFDMNGNPIDDPAGIFLAPHYDMDGGGNSNLQFNSAHLQSGLTAISNFVLGVMER